MISLTCGIIGVLSLFLRMLEKKIKWSLLTFIACSFTQGLLSITLSILFIFTGTNHLQNYNCRFIYGFAYSVLCAIISIVVGLMTLYKLKLNRHQSYQYNLYDLSPNQRQVIIISIGNIGYISLVAFVYAHLENWLFTDALYFVTSTFATIGLGNLQYKSLITLCKIGDFVPTHTISKVSLPLFTTIGIILLGSLIYSTRNVVLEYISLRLANHFSQVYPNPRHQSINEVRASLATSSPVLRPVSSVFILESSERHNELQALDLASPHTSTINISRAPHLKDVTFSTPDSTNGQIYVIEITRKLFMQQLILSALAVILNVAFFGTLFSILEEWNSIFDGFYFSYCILTTIGFGDLKLDHVLSRSLFIWHVIFGIASMTYFSSMLAERALDQWTIEVKRIKNRISRYETKAKLKKKFGCAGSRLSELATRSDTKDGQSSENLDVPTDLNKMATHENRFTLEKFKILSFSEDSKELVAKNFTQWKRQTKKNVVSNESDLDDEEDQPLLRPDLSEKYF